MKILSAQQMQQADAHAIESLEIPARVLMENAGRSVSHELLERYPYECEAGVLLLCGSGNNAGDGFVIARLLHLLGLPVKVLSLRQIEDLKGESLDNAVLAQKLGVEIAIFKGTFIAPKSGIIVDCLFGTGLQGALREPAVSLVREVNSSQLAVIAVDIASGVDASSGEVGSVAVRASHTFALAELKWGNLIKEGESHSGRLSVLDIGIPTDHLEVQGQLLTEDYLLSSTDLSTFVSDRAHKGTRGHLLVVGGSPGTIGAPQLSARAALLLGAGLVSVALPKSAVKRGALEVEELMSVPFAEDPEANFLAEDPSELQAALKGKRALAIGPGMGTGAGASRLLDMALTESCALSLPTVIDADGLNILASNSDIRSKVHPQCILSPHPGEMARLLSDSTQNIQSDRLGAARSLANELSCVLILKGARTIIVGSEGDTWICPISDSSLATAGSGDVLTGILAALLSRGLPAESAACLGVFVHGVAGEVRTELNGGYLGTIASDIARVSAVVLNSLVELSKLSIPPRAKCIDVIPGASDRVRSLILSRADCS